MQTPTMKSVQGYKLDKKIADVLRAALAKDSTRYALNCVLATERELVATDGTQLVAVQFEHGVAPGLYELDGLFLVPATVPPNGHRFPAYQDYWPTGVRTLVEREPKSVARSFTMLALTHQNCIDVWRFEKTLKAVDKLKITKVVVKVQPPYTETAPTMLVAVNHEVTVKALFMPFNHRPQRSRHRRSA